MNVEKLGFNSFRTQEIQQSLKDVEEYFEQEDHPSPDLGTRHESARETEIRTSGLRAIESLRSLNRVMNALPPELKERIKQVKLPEGRQGKTPSYLASARKMVDQKKLAKEFVNREVVLQSTEKELRDIGTTEKKKEPNDWQLLAAKPKAELFTEADIKEYTLLDTDRETIGNFVCTQATHVGGKSPTSEEVRGGLVQIRQQGTRSRNEDYMMAGTVKMRILDSEIEIPYSGVMDGHGGDSAAHLVMRSFATMFTENLHEKKLEYASPEERIYSALKWTFEELENRVRANLQTSGTTFNLVLHFNNNIWTANTGDSAALLVTANKFIRLSEPMTADSRFKGKVQKRGGEVIRRRVSAMLGVMGAIEGEKYPGLKSRPKISRIEEPQEPFAIVQFSDGLSDVMEPEEIAQRVAAGLHTEDPQETSSFLSQSLVGQAIDRGTKDNVSVSVMLSQRHQAAPSDMAGKGEAE